MMLSRSVRRCTGLSKSTCHFVRKLSEEGPKRSSAFGRGPVTFASLALTAAVGVGVVLYFNVQKEEKLREVSKNVVTVGKAALGGPWVLVDQEGVTRTDASYKGKFTLLYFGFTHCPDICPSELVKVAKIVNALEKRGYGSVVKPLFVSVDPARDTVGQLRHYSQDFHPAITYLTGTPEQIARVARAYRVYFSKVTDADLESEDEYLVDHSIVLYLNSPTGEFLEFFTQRMDHKDVVDKIAEHIKKSGIAKK